MAESPTMEVRARLTADSANFVGGMDKAVKSANEFQGAASKLQSSINAVGIASGVIAGSLIAFGIKSFKAAAEVERLDLALQAVGRASGKGYDALKQTSDSMRRLGIQAAVAQQTTLKFAQSNIDLSKASALAKAAQDLSVASNTSAEQALQSITFAVTRGNTRVLQQVGITTGASDAYEIYGRSIGKAAKDLTMAERRQAVVNLVLKEGTKATGAYALALESPAKLITLFGDLHNELQIAMGGALVKGFGPIIKATFKFEKTIIDSISSGGKLAVIIEAIEKVIVKLTTPIANAINKLSDFITNMDMTGTKVNDLASKFEMILPVIAGFGAAFATKAGTAVFGTLPIFGNLLRMLNPIAIGFIAMALTSTQVQSAIAKLVRAFRPMLGVVKSVADIFAKVLVIAVMVLAKTIDGLATIVSESISFVQRFSTAFEILAGALVTIGVAFLIYNIQQKLFTAYTALMTLVMVQSTTAMGALNAVLAANPMLRVVLVIGALVTAFVVAYKTSETFRKVVGMVFNFVAKIVVTVLGYIIQYFGYVLKTLASAMKVFGFFAEVIAKVFEFVIDVFLTFVKFVLTAFKNVIDGFINLMETNDTFRKIVETVFNVIIRIIALAVTMIITSFANILKAIATGIYIFEKLLEVTKTIVKGVIAGFSILGKGVFNIFKSVAGGIGDFLGDALETVKGWVMSLINYLSKIPGVDKLLKPVVDSLKNFGSGFINNLKNIGGKLSDALFGSTEKGSEKSIDAITAVSKTLISHAKSWGNYSEGAAGAISSIANKMLDFNMKVVDLAAKDNGSKIVEGLIAGAKKASPLLEKMIAGLGTVIKFDFAGTVGKFIEEVANKADEAGDKLIEFGKKMVVFAQETDFTEGLKDLIGNIRKSLEEGLGFGDILKKEKEKAEKIKAGGIDEDALNDIQGSADLMKKIREAMKAGIESMSDVLKDLQQAAKDFADSLKDTILGFAGLKGVELPDGFIPKAKSLIENMQTRLNKSNQFAQQITQLQALGLDAKAIQDLVESGPIKGAQIAASILGGGAEAIAQINEIQRAISITGAAIGKFGSEAAFGEKISNAQMKLAQVTDAEARISGVRGNNIVIEQGAFVVNVDTTGATSIDEKADIITQRIQETFAILAKELANK